MTAATAKKSALDVLRDVHELTVDNNVYNEYSWAIVGYKLAYYHPELIKPEFIAELQISNEKYDRVCAKYLKACLSVNKTNNVLYDCTVANKRFPTIGPVTGLGMEKIDLFRSCAIDTLEHVGFDDWRVIARETKEKSS